MEAVGSYPVAPIASPEFLEVKDYNHFIGDARMIREIDFLRDPYIFSLLGDLSNVAEAYQGLFLAFLYAHLSGASTDVGPIVSLPSFLLNEPEVPGEWRMLGIAGLSALPVFWQRSIELQHLVRVSAAALMSNSGRVYSPEILHNGTWDEAVWREFDT